MNKVKYQIFVSSTYDDLKEERDQIIKACLEMGHIPVGMEMFSAADEEQWQIITRQIDESDYYVIVVANRYGSTVDGISYTEKEYDYAIAKGVPILGFVLNSTAAWPINRAETSKAGRIKLEAFKQKVKLKPVNFWTNKEDLHGKCAVALMKTFNTQPRPGWVRSTDAMGPEVASEISRLSSENARLNREMGLLLKTSDTSAFAQGNDVLLLCFMIYRDTVNITTTWDEVFFAVAQKIIDTPREKEARAFINRFYYQRAEEEAKVNNIKISTNAFYRSVIIIDKDFQLIRAQLMALRLIQVDQVEYEYEEVTKWSLTQIGKNLYASMLAVKKD